MAQEKTYENKIKKYLKDNGCWFVKYFANRMTKSGIPDLLVCVNGYFVAIEVKAQNGKASELQYEHQKQIRASGGISIILYPDQWEEFKILIQKLLDDKYKVSEQIYFDTSKLIDKRKELNIAGTNSFNSI